MDGQRHVPAGAPSPGEALPFWRSLAVCEDGCSYGLAYFAGKVSRPRLEFHALRVYLSCPGLRMVAIGGGYGYGGEVLSTRVSSFVQDRELLAGINALPFYPVSGREGEPRANTGIVVADGRVVSPPHHRFDALVFFKDGGAAIKPQSEIHCTENIVTAVGGFFRVLEDYRPVPRVPYLTARHPRSAAGLSSCGGFLFLLVIDGRRPGSVGATEMDTALLLRSLGASEGINFDGGGSSSLAVRFPDGAVRVVNTPIHRQIPGRERAVAGSLGVAVIPRDL